jgi:ActR/RegA family two-component response regulator
LRITQGFVMNPPPPPATEDETLSLAARCVRALLERHGLPKYRQSAWLADATGLSYSQAHRRLSGTAPWTLEELERVGALFGETLAQVVAVAQPSAPAPVRGVMALGTASVECQMWLGDPVQHPTPGSVVAVKTPAGWTAVGASEAMEGVTYTVERIEAKPATVARKVVAVLDDDRDLTDTICEHLNEGGYAARPFYETNGLLASAKLRRYDAFVIDWIVGEASTLSLIAALRAQDATCPIVVLTAQVLTGLVDEVEIADAVKTYNLGFSEKPVRMSILSAMLSRAFVST